MREQPALHGNHSVAFRSVSEPFSIFLVWLINCAAMSGYGYFGIVPEGFPELPHLGLPACVLTLAVA